MWEVGNGFSDELALQAVDDLPRLNNLKHSDPSPRPPNTSYTSALNQLHSLSPPIPRPIPAMSHEHHGKGLSASSAFPNPINAVPHKEALEKIRVLMECVAACENCADRAVEVGSLRFRRRR